MDRSDDGDGHFGPYELKWEIGAGGMATVHAASLPGPGGFEKIVCIKRIRPEMTETEGFVDSFVNEAKLAAVITHPNVVQVSDLGVASGTYYIAMEYVAGVDVLTLLQAAGERGVLLPVVAATYVARELCEGLDAAHRQGDMSGRPLGIVHRDVSPQNVLVSYEGQVKITDFGVAKSKMKVMTTMPGLIKGKANYMSPEQARGEPVDARTDIFAAGILLHEMLSGEPFYKVSDPARLIARARKEQPVPPLSKFRQDVPPPLEAVVQQALQHDPVDRFPTAAEMSYALTEVLNEGGGTYGATDLSTLVEWLLDDAEEAPSEPVELDSAPTRVATADEIRQRRMKRAAGLVVKPAPPGVVASDASRAGFGRRLAKLARRFLAADTQEGG
ncbi:MAG: serine/threonine protein kinase [Sandaracinaceae bacterium]|nr:MAG: serine/threonine protein kinase [Sandaracinaceae bacterium]